MKLLFFGYIKICDKETGKVLLGKPVAFKSAYLEVDLTDMIKDIGLTNLIIKVDARALRKLQGGTLILRNAGKEVKMHIAGVDISKPLVLTDLKQYFITSAEKNDVSQCCNHEMTFLFDEEWLSDNQEEFIEMLAGKA
jgi:hypothetical protein